jgi:3-phosphoshikimate 1-carboxyvinyltransferase
LVERVYVGQARAGFLEVLRRMGADIVLEDEDRVEHTATIRARSSQLHGTSVGGPEVPGLIDEIPVLAVAAALADGPTTFCDAAGLMVEGTAGRPLSGGSVDSWGDHRIAMAMAIAGLRTAGEIGINGWDSVATSYPGFEEDLRRCVS